MKVYRRIILDIKTGSILYEDSYKYSGKIAECKGGGTTVTEYQSPEQKEIYAQFIPIMQKLAASAQGGPAAYDIPQYPTAPTAPSMQGVLSGTPQYQIPNIQQMMPSQQWYSDLSPEVMAGIRAPYEDASKQLTESLGYSAGSPMAGASGVLGGSQAKFWEYAGRNMGQQAWNMTAPAMQQGWQAQLGQSQLGYQNLQQERTADYQNILAQQQAGYAGQQNMWTQQMQQAMLPYTIAPGLMGGTYSSPVVNQPGASPMGGAIAGGTAGYFGGAAAGATYAATPSALAAGSTAGAWGGPVGMGLGALLGYYLSQ